MAGPTTLPENILRDIRLAISTGLITPPLSARSTEPGAIRIGDETFDPSTLSDLITRKIQSTPVTDLMFDIG
ncbi:MAG: hypothetical protein WC851_00170 [Candidatus Shapirobacteria bacterium]|jgi:hypothetical protein